MKPKKIVIIGGGTAGWMAANLIAQAWADQGIAVTLVESEAIGTVGVGEGSTPFMRELFNRLNVRESEWMPACNATYKCGIRFPGWSNQPGYESYFHPFYSEVDTQGAIAFFKACYARRMGYGTYVSPDPFFVTSELARQQLAPVSLDHNRQGLDYGYHFDSELLGRFLRGLAEKRGVRRIEDRVVRGNVSSRGDISSVSTEKHGEIEADFFVDCSGFSGLLIQGALGEQLKSYRDYLFNDSAVAIPTDYAKQEGVPSETVSQAMKFGWVWHIPLMNRVGNGYVYCSDYVSQEDAEAEFRRHLGIGLDGPPARHIRWNPGRITEHWKANCVAIGLSQGFLEPLEAPMLNIIQRSCEDFIDLFEKGGFTDRCRQKFNRRINALIDGTRDYLQAHYLVSSRDDTSYWMDNRTNSSMSPDLHRLVQAWDQPGGFDQVLADLSDTQVYLKTSWYCLLAGLGRFNPPVRDEPPQLQQAREEAHQRSLTIARGFYEHKRWLGLLQSRP